MKNKTTREFENIIIHNSIVLIQSIIFYYISTILNKLFKLKTEK